MKRLSLSIIIILILFSASKCFSFELFTSQITATPAIDSTGNIYTGIASNDTLYCIDSNGNLKWQLKFPEALTNNSPVIDEDINTLYIANGSYLYSVSLNGKFNWRFNTGGEIYSTPAIGYDHTIYLPVTNKNKGELFAISKDGVLIWKKDIINAVVSSPAIDNKQNIYFSIRMNGIISLKPDGTYRWFYNSYDISDSSPAIDDNNTVYVAGDYLYSLNSEDGDLLWKFKLGALGSSSSPVIDENGNIYILSDKLYSIDKIGKLKWTFEYESSYYSNSTPAVSNQNIYFYTGKYLYSLNKEGSLNYKKEIGYDSSNKNSPKIDYNGNVIINSLNGSLYSFSDNNTLNNIEWSSFHNLPSNSGRKLKNFEIKCSSDNLFFCKNQNDCINNEGKWCNTYCSSSDCLVTTDNLNKPFNIFFQYFSEEEKSIHFYKNADFNLTICALNRYYKAEKAVLYVVIEANSNYYFITKPFNLKYWDLHSKIDKTYAYTEITESNCIEIISFKVNENIKGDFKIYSFIAPDTDTLNFQNLLSNLIFKELSFN